MERTGLLKEGDILPITEYELPNDYYYVLGKSFAMSDNFKRDKRLKSTQGKVLQIENTTRGYYVTVELEED